MGSDKLFLVFGEDGSPIVRFLTREQLEMLLASGTEVFIIDRVKKVIA